MQSLIRNVRKCLLAVLALLAPAMPVRADVTYLLNNYPDEQAGFTLSGSITVVDTAADDGLLQVGEIVHWTFTVTNGATTVTADSATTPNPFIQIIAKIHISGADIRIPAGYYNRLAFYSSSSAVGWERSTSYDGPCTYCQERYQMVHEGQFFWDYQFPDNYGCSPLDNPWLIATNPNPPPSPGACCNPATGGCVVLSVDDCTALGLTFVGSGVTCAAAACTACPADFNGDGAVTVPDIFSFLAAWFAGCP